MPLNNNIFTTNISTPIGELVAGATDKGICLLEFAERKNIGQQLIRVNAFFKKEIIPGKNVHLLMLDEQLKKYFNKELQGFEIPLDLAGTTFQLKVWKALLEIPSGTTISYLILSEKLGNVKAIRAVANAIAANKTAIIVPCHRVIGTDGNLTGYAGGLWRKKYLLNHEGLTKKGQQMILDIL